MSKTDIGDMAAVGTVLVTRSLYEINQTRKLNSFCTCLLTAMEVTKARE